MSDILVKTIGSIVGAIIGALMTYLLNKWNKNKIFKANLNEYQKSIQGHWRGIFIEEWQPDKPEVEITDVDIKLKGKMITGICKYFFDGKTIELELKGGYFENDIIKLEYSNKKDCVIHFGTIIIKYSLDGLRCNGNYLTYGLINETIRHGTIAVERIIQ